MRTLKIKFPNVDTGLVSFITNAVTFGEFKQEAPDHDWSKLQMVDRATKAIYVLDDAILPSVDSIMFVVPRDHKGGAEYPYKVAKTMIKDFIAEGGHVPFNYTQATTAKLNEFIEEQGLGDTPEPEEIGSDGPTTNPLETLDTVVELVDEIRDVIGDYPEVVDAVEEALVEVLTLLEIVRGSIGTGAAGPKEPMVLEVTLAQVLKEDADITERLK